MKTATVRQVRNDFKTVLSWVHRGEEVTVLNRTKPVARICPLQPERQTEPEWPDFTSRAQAILGKKRTHFSEHVINDRESRP